MGHFIDREYEGGFLQAIRDNKDQLKAKLSSEEWDSLSQLIGTIITYLTQKNSLKDKRIDIKERNNQEQRKKHDK